MGEDVPFGGERDEEDVPFGGGEGCGRCSICHIPIERNSHFRLVKVLTEILRALGF